MYTYLDYYNDCFASKIKAIDVFLKTHHKRTFTYKEIEALLFISADEIKSLMKTFDLEQLDKPAFFILMRNGSSPVCKLFDREIQRRMPHFYTFDDIAFIYQIPYQDVIKGAMKARLNSITSENMHELFSYIEMDVHQSDFNYI